MFGLSPECAPKGMSADDSELGFTPPGRPEIVVC
jgi:hypothetical protein